MKRHLQPIVIKASCKFFHLLFPILLIFFFPQNIFSQSCTSDAECNDGIACTIDHCDPDAGCVNTPDNTLCDDENVCTSDMCDPSTGCVNTFVVRCTVDNDACTEDVGCLPLTGCSYLPINCDDNIACTTDDCNSLIGCINAFDCFSDLSCCDDENACTVEGCEAVRCPIGPCPSFCTHTPLNCDDGNPCTIDGCDPDNGCTHERDDCDDGFDCTRDDCDPDAGCVNTPDNTLCDDEDACTDGLCAPTTANGGDFACRYNPIICDDENACTIDECDPDNGCTHEEVDCDDGNACTIDSCAPTDNGGDNFECLHDPVNCDDRNPCTTDGCDPATGCTHDRVTCDDGNPCTDDICVPSTVDADDYDCVSRTIDCNDNNPCTTEECLDGECVYTAHPLTVSAGADQNVYPAYSPACAALTASASGGIPGYSYSWSTGATTTSINVCPAASTDYCVTVTDAHDCQSFDCVRVCVRNISCGNNKVNVCHKNPNGTFTTMCLPTAAVAIHLGHGDNLGVCGLAPCSAAAKTSEDEGVMTNEIENIQAYPNPFSEKLNIEFTLANDSHVKLEVFSITGQRLSTVFDGEVKAAELQTFEYNPAVGCDCMVIYRLQTDQGMYYGKAVMVR